MLLKKQKYPGDETPIIRGSALKALEAKKNIICEKPLALTKADCEAIIFKALQMHKTVFSAMLHKDFPFSELPEILQMTRDASHRPFAQATFNWVDYEAFQKRKKPFVTVKDSGKIEWQINGMIWEQIDLRGQTDDSDLVLEILKADGNFLIHWQYNETVFNRPGMMGMANAFISLLITPLSAFGLTSPS